MVNWHCFLPRMDSPMTFVAYRNKVRQGVCFVRIGEVLNLNLVMHQEPFPSVAAELACFASRGQDRFAGALPHGPVRFWQNAAFPGRMLWPLGTEVGPPERGTGMSTKRSSFVEVGCGPDNYLPTPCTGSLHPVSASRFWRPTFPVAFARAEFLSQSSRPAEQLATDRALELNDSTWTPPSSEVALVATVQVGTRTGATKVLTTSATDVFLCHNEISLCLLQFYNIKKVLSSMNPTYIEEIATYKLDEAETGVPVEEAYAGQLTLFGETP